jgi:hypothetical protein
MALGLGESQALHPRAAGRATSGDYSVLRGDPKGRVFPVTPNAVRLAWERLRKPAGRELVSRPLRRCPRLVREQIGQVIGVRTADFINLPG